MDTNKMREQFEDALVAALVAAGWEFVSARLILERGSDGKYRSIKADAGWWAWQASRAAVVVELPDRDVEQCDYSLGFNSCLKQSRSAIEAQGLKVKP